jgi:hypothetical protein
LSLSHQSPSNSPEADKKQQAKRTKDSKDNKAQTPPGCWEKEEVSQLKAQPKQREKTQSPEAICSPV